jgi:hypothetical protein
MGHRLDYSLFLHDGTAMTDLDKYLNMLKSEDADTRFDACDELCVATESSPEIILALEEATQDEDREVAERAGQALGAEVHSQMALKIGGVPHRKTNQLSLVSLVLVDCKTCFDG